MSDVDIERIGIELGVDRDVVRFLVDEGLTDDQVRVMLTDPLSVIEWRTETTTTGDADLDEDGSRIHAMASSEWQSGGLLPRPDGQATVETTNIGSTYNIESARLWMKTTYRWERFEIIPPPFVEHRSSTTTWGGIGGWRVGPSHEGSDGWVTQRTTYRTEIKADWTLEAVAKPIQVGQGTAWIQHTLTCFGIQIDKGGWP